MSWLESGTAPEPANLSDMGPSIGPLSRTVGAARSRRRGRLLLPIGVSRQAKGGSSN